MPDCSKLEPLKERRPREGRRQLACASMSQNNLQNILYAGLDLHKATLQLHLAGTAHELPNDAAGHRRLVRLLTKSGHPVQVICEASGGCERGPLAALHAAQVSVSMINPAQVKAFARALGRRAKTDPLDAELLARYGAALQPAPTPPKTPAQQVLLEIVRYRQQLLEKLVAERQQAEALRDAALRRQARALVRRLEADLRKLDARLAAEEAADTALAAKAERLRQIPGVGAQTSISLLAELPELGTLNRRQAAALAGRAPHPRQSGQWTGQAHIGGGRAPVRKALYMAALCASRHYPPLHDFYERLRTAGKPAKVALTAVMRKLLVLLNLALKTPDFALKNPKLALAS